MINLFVVNVKSRHIFDIPSDLSLSVFAHGSGYNVFTSVRVFLRMFLIYRLFGCVLFCSRETISASNK